MFKFARLGIVLLSAMFLTNCATITRGTVNQIQIVSDPTDADVKTSLGHACRSPCTLTVDRKAEFTVSYRKDGYKDTSVPVATRIAGSGAAGLAGNLILGGIVGIAADAATGATLEHYPNPVSATLEPIAVERAVGRKAKNARPPRPKPPSAPASSGVEPESAPVS